ncbi:MAG: L-fucose:H+ symporter permease [Bacteroidota bacterium]
METAQKPEEKKKLIPAGIVWPFILLTSLFFAWAIPNNLTDTMLAAFKRIMSLSDGKTAWIQVACYLLGYGFFAIPGAIFIKKFNYKSGVLLGLTLYAVGAFLFYPSMLISGNSVGVGFIMFLLALIVLFAGLSVLETSTNSYVLVIGPKETATARLNFAQSFNPFGAIAGVIISQVFVLSQLNTMSADERALLSPEELTKIQGTELTAVTNTYLAVGLVMVIILLLIKFTKMPNLKEDDKSLNFIGAFKRLGKNKNYVWAVVAQFFYVGAQIAVWSYTIRYIMKQLNLDSIVRELGPDATSAQIIERLRNIEPLAAGFYRLIESVGIDSLLPRTPEQAGATYYIIALVLFVVGRFVCTALMRVIRPHYLLTALASLAFISTLVAIYDNSFVGIYALVTISFSMSLMFPTIFGMGVSNLKEDTKWGGAGMVMAIAGAAVLTQMQGIISDQSGSIKLAYWVPAIAFLVIVYYSVFVYSKFRKTRETVAEVD